MHVLVPDDVRSADVPLLVFNDGDTTFWRGGVGHDTWDVAGTVRRLRVAGSIGPVRRCRGASASSRRGVHPRRLAARPRAMGWPRPLRRVARRHAGAVVASRLPVADGCPHPHRHRRQLTRWSRGVSHRHLAPEVFGIAGCLSPSFFSGLDDLDHGLTRHALEGSDLVRRAAPVLADRSRRPRLWIDWGLRRDGRQHDEVVEALAASRGAEMVTLLEARFGARVVRMGAGDRPPRDAEVVQCIDAIGGHTEAAWRHHTELFLRAFF